MTGHNTGAGAREGREITRGTSNSNERGNSDQRRRRRKWLVATYPADRNLWRITYTDGTTSDQDAIARLSLSPMPPEAWAREVAASPEVASVEEIPTCRCARCGELLTEDTVTCDRIFPGHSGGKYGTPRQDAKRLATNVRPHCGPCASITGATGPRPNARRKATK